MAAGWVKGTKHTRRRPLVTVAASQYLQGFVGAIVTRAPHAYPVIRARTGFSGVVMNGIDAPFIVVGVDGSAQSIKALEWAVRHAKLLGADVHAIGAWEVPMTIFITPTYVEADYQRDATVAFEKAIAEALEDLGDDGAGVLIETQVVEQKPSRALHDAARGALSLVIGSHGHGSSFPGMHLGSTASYCVHHSPCPVVVIRDPQA